MQNAFTLATCFHFIYYVEPLHFKMEIMLNPGYIKSKSEISCSLLASGKQVEPSHALSYLWQSFFYQLFIAADNSPVSPDLISTLGESSHLGTSLLSEDFPS